MVEQKNPSQKYDVIVVGAGVAGLCAAIAAADAGSSTMLLEASDTLGGTASWSGGALWIPNNHRLNEAGGNDSRDTALSYMKSCVGELADEAVYTAYLDCADEVIRYLEANTPLELEVGIMPDYQGGKPGGFYQQGLSRSLAPAIFDLNRLRDQAQLLRRSPHGTVPFGFQEFADMNAVLHPERIDTKLFEERLAAGYVGWGEALSGALLLGVLERNIEIRRNTRARKLRANGRIEGVIYEDELGTHSAYASRGVILCAGGYEWDAALAEENFPGVEWQPATVPSNRGDAWAMAAAAGACINNRGHCWGWPGYIIPGEQLPDGHPLVRSALVERTLPHLIIVNSRGERFVDESLPYHAILKAMLERNEQGEFPNLPAWHLFDQQFRDKYAFGPITPGEASPDWMHPAASLESLAKKCSIDASGLRLTLSQFNADVVVGRDSFFGRGDAPYAQFWGDPENQPAPNLGSLEKPPFHAVAMIPSNIGTCGGPRIDRDGRVLDGNAEPIDGLYAAGNATAAISGPAYFGPGGTIGPAMVFGVLAARHAAAGSAQ